MRPLALTLTMALAVTLAVGAQAPADPLFDKFFAAESPADALSAADQLVAAGVEFDAAVIRSPQNGADGEMYGNNLANAPFYIVNGEQDNLYPVYQVEPHIKWFQAMGMPFVFRPQAGAGQNTAWWPTEREPYEKFVREHARVAHPAKVSWETESTDRFNRSRWLVINELRQDASRDTELKDRGFFQHTKLSGRVDVTRTGNVFEAKVRGVAAFTLLLSPDVIDFSKPVTVTVNGKPAFSGVVKTDPATLLRWSARDNDRTALYGAELRITP